MNNIIKQRRASGQGAEPKPESGQAALNPRQQQPERRSPIAKQTKIKWRGSTVNEIMGYHGCERPPVAGGSAQAEIETRKQVTHG